MSSIVEIKKTIFFKRLKKDMRRNKYLYILVIPVVLYFFLFSYLPLSYLLMAFQDFSVTDGLSGSSWVGFKHFTAFFNDYYFARLVRNTVVMSLMDIAFSFPAPIILALMLNSLRSKMFKRTTQTVVYLPFFISLIVVVGIIKNLTGENGIITSIVTKMGLLNLSESGEMQSMLGQPQFFRWINVFSGIWQGVGFSSVIYIAALSGVDKTLYEAADIDGAGRTKKLLYVTLPSIAPMIITMFALRLGAILSVGFEKIVLLYSPATYETADVISTYVYRIGLISAMPQYSYTTAIGLFNSVINFILLVVANFTAKRLTQTSLF